MTILKYDGSAARRTAEATSHFYGTAGTDTLTGTDGAESFWGGQGDLMTGAGGDDTYHLRSASDRVVEAAGGGFDQIVAYANVDLSQHRNIENLWVRNAETYGAGDAQDNVIEGGDGAQQIYGAQGQDVLIGGAGADVFIVRKGEGNDALQDFNAAEDKVRLSAGLTDFSQVKARLVQQGLDVKLDLGGGDALVFRDMTPGQLTAANFQLELDHSKLGVRSFTEDFDRPLSLWDAQSNPGGVWRPDYGYQGSQGAGSYSLIGNNETQIYTSPYFRDHPGDFTVSPFVQNADGTLTIQARTTTNPEVTEWGYGVTSGMLTTRGGTPWTDEAKHPSAFAQTYGYFEMRADLSEVPGTWGAFWLAAADYSWPPELDVVENPIGDPNSAWTSAHSNATGVHTSVGQANFVPGSATGFHTYGALWTPTTLTWYVDGVEVFKAATPADMNKPMSLIVNLATGGWAGEMGDLSAADMRIDYIHAYELGSGGAPPPGPSPDPGTPTYQNALFTLAESGAWTKTFTGAAKKDSLTGTAGNDLLDGKGNPDTLKGAAGDDTFVVDRPDDQVIELAGGGVDTVHSTGTSYTLPDQVENLKLTGSGVQAGTGNALNNRLVSNDAASTLSGGAGDDILVAGRGANVLTGGAGRDIFDFDRLPTQAGRVADFTRGEDMLDLRTLFSASGYKGADPIADRYLELRANDTGGTAIYFDADGPVGGGGRILLTTLDKVQPAGLSMQNDWFFV
jgi:serralysin